ncbi:hypothetical protein LX73_0464 [Fodinibius salinus]|uniref:Uncharacterized protein n=2 Tax=Fodinibius salinus TaxID=860790 RepID=A0A5D3YPK3_9BACT|nr:hypothetical protein LX73_0464 [Fodinibius salinus]
MELDELKKVWKNEQPDPQWEYSRAELLMLLNNKVISFEKEVQSRDKLEILACIIVVIFFGVTFFLTSSIWQRTGSAILVVAAGFICYRLYATSKRSADKDHSKDQTMADYLKAELEFVKRQKQLLNNIFWWYILPLTIGLLCFAAGFQISPVYKYGYMGVVLLIGAIVWKLNRNTAAQRFDPLLTEIEDALHLLEENE